MSGASLFKPFRGSNMYKGAVLAFSFATNSTSDPDTTLFRGEKVATIVRSDVGLFTVTLDAAYREVVAATAAVRDAVTPDGHYATVYIADEAADPLVLKVQVFDDTGAAVETTSRRVSVVLFIETSSAG